MRLAGCACVLLVLMGSAVAQDTNFPVGPQYLITTDSTLLLRPIATPSLSFDTASAIAPPITAGAVPASQVVETPPPLPPNLPDLTRILWGDRPQPAVSEIEISAEPAPRNLPPSFIEVGVTAVVGAATRPQEGYGVSLAEAAAFWKGHKGQSPRIYTNRDLARLHGG